MKPKNLATIKLQRWYEQVDDEEYDDFKEERKKAVKFDYVVTSGAAKSGEFSVDGTNNYDEVLDILCWPVIDDEEGAYYVYRWNNGNWEQGHLYHEDHQIKVGWTALDKS